MYTRYLARIRAEEYDAFLRIPTLGLPDAFKQWTYGRDQLSAQTTGGGNKAIFVEVGPDEFAAYCRAIQVTCDDRNLDHFAYAKATRIRDRI